MMKVKNKISSIVKVNRNLLVDHLTFMSTIVQLYHTEASVFVTYCFREDV